MGGGSRAIVLCGALVAACSPELMVQVVRQPDAPALSSRDDRCELAVYQPYDAAPPADCREVGDVFVGDTGGTADCAWPRVFDEVRRQACRFGADAAQVVRIHEPSFFGSSCYQARARFLVCATREARP